MVDIFETMLKKRDEVCFNQEAVLEKGEFERSVKIYDQWAEKEINVTPWEMLWIGRSYIWSSPVLNLFENLIETQT